MIGYQGTHDPS